MPREAPHRFAWRSPCVRPFPISKFHAVRLRRRRRHTDGILPSRTVGGVAFGLGSARTKSRWGDCEPAGAGKPSRKRGLEARRDLKLCLACAERRSSGGRAGVAQGAPSMLKLEFVDLSMGRCSGRLPRREGGRKDVVPRPKSQPAMVFSFFPVDLPDAPMRALEPELPRSLRKEREPKPCPSGDDFRSIRWRRPCCSVELGAGQPGNGALRSANTTVETSSPRSD